MDNVTHSLIGYALARAGEPKAQRTITGEPAVRSERNAAIASSVLASNAPDLDFAIGWFAHDEKLAYLLHHRGHTHTLIVALGIGLALGLVLARAFGVPEGSARRRVVGLGVLAALLHIGFDALNDYGVHPFYPFDNRWYFGDAVFIIEPLLLAALLPLLILRAHTRPARILGGALGCGLLWLLWGPGLLPAGVSTFASAALVLALAAQHRLGARPMPALAAAALLVAVFGATSVEARARFAHALAASAPGDTIAQLITRPLPANPLCWSAIAVTTDARAEYRAHFAELSLWPDLIAPERCRLGTLDEGTAELGPSELPGAPGLRFTHVYRLPLEELRALRRQHCAADAALRFMRAPFVGREPGDSSARPLLGDLRYDREPELGFAELPLHDDCRDPIPPWIPPLADVLD